MNEKTCNNKCENCIDGCSDLSVDCCLKCGKHHPTAYDCYQEPCELNGHIGECYMCPDSDNKKMSCWIADEDYTELS